MLLHILESKNFLENYKTQMAELYMRLCDNENNTHNKGVGESSKPWRVLTLLKGLFRRFQLNCKI